MKREKRLTDSLVLAHPPGRGQILWADLGDPVGHEQGFQRPFLILSNNQLNGGVAGIVIGVPLTTRDRGLASDVRVVPPEADLEQVSFVQPEFIRCISVERLRKPLGLVSPRTLDRVEDALRILIEL